MSTVYLVIAIVLALALVGSGAGKLSGSKNIVDNITGLGVPRSWLPFLAACEIAGAVGLIVGIWWTPLGIAAAIGVILYFVGAVGAHLRKADFKGLPPAAFLLVVGVAALVPQVV